MYIYIYSNKPSKVADAPDSRAGSRGSANTQGALACAVPRKFAPRPAQYPGGWVAAPSACGPPDHTDTDLLWDLSYLHTLMHETHARVSSTINQLSVLPLHRPQLAGCGIVRSPLAKDEHDGGLE